jgi:hypothetical protein
VFFDFCLLNIVAWDLGFLGRLSGTFLASISANVSHRRPLPSSINHYVFLEVARQTEARKWRAELRDAG